MSAQFLQSIVQNSEETVPFHKIFAQGKWVKLRYLRSVGLWTSAERILPRDLFADGCKNI